MARSRVRETVTDIQFQLRSAALRDAEIARKSEDFAEEVKETAKRIWREEGPHPYETGTFEASIHKRKTTQRRDVRGRFAPGWNWWVGSDDPIANMLEFGTGPDKPGSRSPFGPNTPTPEFAVFAKTAAYYRGTAP